jgi:hypothetical protein
MKKIAFVFIAAMTVLSFGCKKKNDAKEVIAKVEGFKTAMCACKAGDKACAEKVEKDMKAYMDSMQGKGEKDAKVSADDEKKMTAVMGDYMKCQQAATTDPAAAAGTPPAGDPAAAGGTVPAGTPPPADPAGAAAGTAPAGSAAAPAAGGDMKGGDMKGEPKKEEMKK